ncbi:MAG: hypothetical protein ABI680_05095 [Chthoniobacteraceae bacterium]
MDAPAALRWLASSATFEQNYGAQLAYNLDGVSSTVFKVVARRQPDWLREHLATLNPGAPRDLGIFHLVNVASRNDANDARRLLAEYADGLNRSAAVLGCVHGLAKVDFRAAFDIAAAESAGPFRRGLLMTVFSETARRGVGAVRELLDRIDDSAQRREMAGWALSAMSWKSRDDPLPWIIEETQRAGSFAPGSRAENLWAGGVGLAVQENGPAPAADWAVTLASDPEKKMLSQILKQWTGRSPDEVRAWLAHHAAELNTSAVEELGYDLSTMAREESDAMRAWASALPPSELRDRVQFELALGAGAQGDLAQAAAAYQSVASNDADGARFKQLAMVIARRDAAAAAEWAMSFPDGPARVSAVSAAAARWSETDLRSAAEWLGQLPSGAEHDAAVREYAAKVVYADPVAAAEWVAQVSDPTVRADAARKGFDIWDLEDPVASRAWLRALEKVDEELRPNHLMPAK